ncbi:phage antirepressor KilAC domain-containing protein [Mucilaginibacter sp. PAMB04168]|uniref:phage antirepressor KilAC domain-containing protein n=1 Tax=Mucilaginibacter sp. PAMB04168 TaxID=3138567 RepID=UPI0031F625D5
MQNLSFIQNQRAAYQNWYDMKTAAKLVNAQMGRTKLFKYLREQGFLMDDNIPYQIYIDRALFKVTIKDVRGKYGQLLFKSVVTLVSDLGIDAIKQSLKNNFSNEPKVQN